MAVIWLFDPVIRCTTRCVMVISGCIHGQILQIY